MTITSEQIQLCEPVFATHKIMRQCRHCGNITYFIVSAEQYERYIINHEFAQDVFVQVPAPIRETIISGTHPKCWDEIFAHDDDDEEDI